MIAQETLVRRAFADFTQAIGLSGEAPGLRLTPAERVILPSLFAVDAFAAACVATAYAALARYVATRDGTAPQEVGIDIRHAAHAFRTERYLRVGSEAPKDPWAPLSGDYVTAGDGRLRIHANFEAHARAAQRVLGEGDREEIARACASRDAFELEEAIVAQGGAAAALRTREQWLAHPQAIAVRAEPLVDRRSVSTSPPFTHPRGEKPLAGVRVFDVTRIIAGPVAGRVLAAFGAEVVHVSAEHLETIPLLEIDTGFGKRQARFDLRQPAALERFLDALPRVDVVVDSYRPGALAALGAGALATFRKNRSAIYCSIAAWGIADASGENGPWALRRGFDSLVQTANGIAAAGAAARASAAPVPLPAQALDHGTGWLAAAAVCAALERRARIGGAHRLRLSLARTGEALYDLGVANAFPAVDDDDPVDDLLIGTESVFGSLTALRFPGTIGGKSLGQASPPVRPPA